VGAVKPPRDSVLPVFPLPGMVLFPRVVVPLHIFEPRYRQMLREILDSHGRVAMALAVPGGDVDHEATWEISPTVGVGKVLTYRKNDDGTSDILLVGDVRGRVETWREGKPYRTATIRSIEDEKPKLLSARDRLRAELRGHLATLLSRHFVSDDATEITQTFAREQDIGFLCDFLAYRFLKDPRERQSILEETNIERRAELLREHLATRELI